MFLEEYVENKEGSKVLKLARESTTYNRGYMYWRDALFERVMRLFVWEGTGELKPKEIEQRLHIAGHCGITKINGEKELTAMFGTFYGVTKYIDEFTNYMVRCPIYSGKRTIGKDVVVINNNSLRNATYYLIHHYAVLLAHTEVTLVNELVNARDSGGIPIASTEKQKASILDYQGKVYNGQYGVVSDMGMLGVNYAGTDRKTAQNIIDIIEVREKLIKSFYSDIGVRSAFEKRNNTVQAEVEADTSLLLLNLSDMLDCRKKACEEVNDMFGTNWSVHVAEEIDYGAENQRTMFDSNTEIHVEPNPEDNTDDNTFGK
ncbi:hypothetical protein ACR77U_12735 [Enterococcus faecium]|uniref:hypothetical protein n=1 Tax=Enterococcus faecium TaxID=1352 RepID=UPI003DA46472